MDKWFCIVTDGIEWAISQWWGFSLYAALMLACLLYWDWNGIDRFVYITNALLVVMVLNSTRRDSLAVHIKLDGIIPPEDRGIEKNVEKDIKEHRGK